jgi:hypothetical protein
MPPPRYVAKKNQSITGLFQLQSEFATTIDGTHSAADYSIGNATDNE